MRVWIPVDVTRRADGPRAFVYERDDAGRKPTDKEVEDYVKWSLDYTSDGDSGCHVVWVEANVPLPPRPKMVRVKGKVAKP